MTLELLPILALGFGSPLLLWGLALGSIPVIIHLLHKRQYRETEWAAMRFLLEAARKNSRRMRLEQLILLLVRVLLFVLLALALAEPLAESYSTLVDAPRPVHRILVIDSSFSMGYRVGETTRFEQAREAAKEIVESSREGDAFNLVRICDSMPRVVVRQPAYRAEQVVDEIDALKITEEPGDLVTSLKDVDVLVGTLPEISEKQITIISDMQRSSWSPESAGPRTEIRQLLKKIAGASELTLVDLGRADSANRSLIELRADEPSVTVGQEVLVHATVQNFGTTRLDHQAVELYVDDVLAGTEPVAVDSASTAVADFRTSFSQGGEHRIEARMAGDELPVDDRRWLSLPSVETLNILLVNGKAAGRSEERATFYLETVVSPSTLREPWHGATRAVVIGEGELAAQDLNRYDAVFLCDVGLLTEGEAALLQAYVESGGGLVVFPGNLTAADNYNQLLYRDGGGLLPARLGERNKISATDADGFRFDLADLTHPIVRAFEGNPGTGLESAITLEYLRATVPADSQSRVALRYGNGDPAIVEKTVGRGRSILVTTSADVEWGTWPVVRSFPAVVHEMILFAVAGRRAQRGLLVGEPISKSYAARGVLSNAIVHLPGGRKETVPLTELGGLAKLTFDATNQNGIYGVELPGSGNSPELFAVNIDRRESDLTKITEQELDSDLLPQIPYVYQTSLDNSHDESAPVDADRSQLTRWLLLTVFALLFVEQLMAWRFLYGLLLLSVLATLAFAWQARLWHPAGPALVTVVALAGLGAFWLLIAPKLREQRPGILTSPRPRRRNKRGKV